MGGFVAAEFAAKHPNLVNELILVSVREKYKEEKLEEIKKLLRKNKKGYLYKFYTECFSGREKMGWFRRNLLKTYCEGFDLDSLLAGLDYLRDARIKKTPLERIKKITIAHGLVDKIAPLEEARAIKAKLPHARFFSIKDAGHMPFLEEGFSEKI
jgi:pimeloyl-ACP methyl ester carboxylesterase